MGLSEIPNFTQQCVKLTQRSGLAENQKEKSGNGNKMHIFKKIKKRFGLVRRNSASCPGTNNLPPLQFHSVHGDNIRVSRDGTLARRFESFCRAITFSARPVRINERICVKFSEISNNWNGGIRFGFTSNDPSSLNNALPKYACPDLTNRPGFWAKALHEQYCEKDNVLSYYVNSAGDVIYWINNEEKGVILSGIDTRGLLWTVIDIYGNCTAVEFLDSNNYASTPSYVTINTRDGNQRRSSLNLNEVDEVVVSSMQSLTVSNDMHTGPSNRYNANRLIPINFHTTKGRNIILSQDHFIATRIESDFCQGYVFTARPIGIGENIIIEILKTEKMYLGTLAFGLTSCNPATLQPSDLPDDSDFLLDRPEYWVISKDVVSAPQCGDEITFFVAPNGEVTISKNNGPADVVMHVDQSLQLWPFFDIYGSTQSVRVFWQQLPNIVGLQQQHPNCAANQTSQSSRHLHINIPVAESLNSLNSQISEGQKIIQAFPLEAGNNNSTNVTRSSKSLSTTTALQSNSALASTKSNERIISMQSNGEMIQIQPGGTVLVVNLPGSSYHDMNQMKTSQPRLNQIPQAITAACSRGAILSTTQCSEPLSSLNISGFNSFSKWKDERSKSETNSSGAECTICYENPIDSVLYMCGHMCMCYECAIEQWRGVGGGQCPLCRAVIRDVIRTYAT